MIYKLQAKRILLGSRFNDIEDVAVKLGWSKSNWAEAGAILKEIDDIDIQLKEYDKINNIER